MLMIVANKMIIKFMESKAKKLAELNKVIQNMDVKHRKKS